MNDREKSDRQIDSPGNGMTVMRLSKHPLATEGEATPGADDYNPYEDPDGPDPPTAGDVPDFDEPEPQAEFFPSGQPELPPSPLLDSSEWVDPDWPGFLK
jgi:hypothetical protein